VIVAEDEIVHLLAGAGDELGLGLGLGQGAQKLPGRRQDAHLDDIDVGSPFHGTVKLRPGEPAIKPGFGGERGERALGSEKSGQNKAGRLPLTGPLLLS
jgi:hypothetical protein